MNPILAPISHALMSKKIQDSIDFYMKLGFKIREDHREGNWAVLQHNNMVLCLFEGHVERNLINFRGGDIEAIEKIARAGYQVHETSIY
jgi:predicted lactoylglutathione lyase